VLLTGGKQELLDRLRHKEPQLTLEILERRISTVKNLGNIISRQSYCNMLRNHKINFYYINPSIFESQRGYFENISLGTYFSQDLLNVLTINSGFVSTKLQFFNEKLFFNEIEGRHTRVEIKEEKSEDRSIYISAILKKRSRKMGAEENLTLQRGFERLNQLVQNDDEMMRRMMEGKTLALDLSTLTYSLKNK
jgi:hypothetical protein